MAGILPENIEVAHGSVADVVAGERKRRERFLRRRSGVLLDPPTEAEQVVQVLGQGVSPIELLGELNLIRTWETVIDGVVKVTATVGGVFQGRLTDDFEKASREAMSTRPLDGRGFLRLTRTK